MPTLEPALISNVRSSMSQLLSEYEKYNFLNWMEIPFGCLRGFVNDGSGERGG